MPPHRERLQIFFFNFLFVQPSGKQDVFFHRKFGKKIKKLEYKTNPLPPAHLSAPPHSSVKRGSVTAWKRDFAQPDCNRGWDSHRECYFFGYHPYMYVASDSHSDLPVFPLLERASRHDMLSFLHSFFTMKAYLPEFRIEKLLLDSAHDAYPVYEYCRREDITPFIDLSPGHTGHFIYKDDFTIDDDGVPVCKMDFRMHKDGYSGFSQNGAGG